jgi:hypothetical protein
MIVGIAGGIVVAGMLTALAVAAHRRLLPQRPPRLAIAIAGAVYLAAAMAVLWMLRPF